MKKNFLSLIIFADMLKYKIIFSKNTFISFETLILILIDKYLIIFIHLSIITKIKSYTTLSRLFESKLIMKFIKISFQDILDINKKLSSLYNL